MREFYDLLRRVGIYEPPDAEEVVWGFDGPSLRWFLEEAYWTVNAGAERSSGDDLFAFAASSAMSGGAFPCASVGCRLERAQKLAIFAALYANKVFLPNFFEYGAHQRFDLRRAQVGDVVRNQLVGDIAVYMQYRPLIQAGRVAVFKTAVAVCPECLRHRVMEDRTLKRELTAAKKAIEPLLRRRLMFTVLPDGYVRVDDPDDLLEEKPGFIPPRSEVSPWLNKAPYTLTERELRRLGYRDWLVGHVVDDLVFQKWSPAAVGTSYLTTRPLDSVFIEVVKPEGDAARNLPGLLEHMIPLPSDLNVRAAVHLRKRAPEVFENYRASVTRLLLKAARATRADEVADGIRNDVEPELTAISAAMAGSRRSRRAEVGKGLLRFALTAGVVEGASVFGGQSAGSAIGTAALAGAAGLAATAVTGALPPAVPEAVVANPFYFLWKVTRASH